MLRNNGFGKRPGGFGSAWEPLESRLHLSAAPPAVPWAEPAGVRVAFLPTPAEAGGDDDDGGGEVDPAPRLTVDVSALTFTDAVGGGVGPAEFITVTNTGTGDLLIPPSGFTLTGTGAGQFKADVGGYPLLLPAGASAQVGVRMNATKAGLAAATLTVAGNDATGAVGRVTLRGMGTAAGTKGPTAQQMLDVNGVPVTLARQNEREMGVLTKAGPGPVTIQVLGTTESGSLGGEPLRFGWYAPGTTPQTTQLFVTGEPVTVSPTVYGATQFDPGGAAFGLYAEWPGLPGRNSWSQDGANAWETAAAAKRKIHFYPLRDAGGAVVPDAYVVTVESASATASRLGALVVRNVRHASLPLGWQSAEVGATGTAGAATVAGGTYTLTGGGAGAAGTADALHYAYRTLRGDGEVIARVASVQNTNKLAGAGVVIRASLDANVANATMELTAGGGTSFHARTKAGATTTAVTTAGVAGPQWVRLVRAGNTITGYRSKDGVTWVKQGSAVVPLGADVLVGLAVTAHDNAKLATGIFDNVRIKPTLAANRPPVAPLVIAPDVATGPVVVAARSSDAAASAKLLIDGVAVGTFTGPGPYTFRWDSRSAVDGDHALSVVTTDRFGVTTTWAGTLATSNPDLPPTIRLTGPGQGTRLAGVIKLSAAAGDERGVAGVTYLLDGNPIGPEIAAAPYALAWDTAGAGEFSPGWHALTAAARDTAGNVTTSLPVEVWAGDPATAPAADLATGVQIAGRRKEDWPWVNYAGRVLPAGLQLPADPRSRFGGDGARNVGGTGFFRSQKVDGRWWLVDPDGYLYFDSSVTSVSPNVYDNNRAVFQKQFGTGATGNANWAKWVKGWLAGIGINSAAPWSSPAIFQQAGVPTNYSLVLDVMSGVAKSVSSAVPVDGIYANGTMPVFDPRFAAYCDTYFAKVFPAKFPGLSPKTDPYLVGYMTDNELPWDSSTLDHYLALPAGDVNRAAAEAWLRGRNVTAPTDADRQDFLSYVADTYFRLTSRALRAYDPNHLILGARFKAGDGVKPYLHVAAKPYIDVASVNYYDDLDPATALAAATAAADLPYMITESYTKGIDSGLANKAGFGLTVYSQADRGAYYQSMALSVMGSTNGVGLAWLSLMDNNTSNAGADPSNTDANKGLMPVTYPLTQAVNPYKPLTDRVRDVNANAYALIHDLMTPPAG